MNFRQRELRKFYESLRSSDRLEFLWYTNKLGTRTTLRYYGSGGNVKIPPYIENESVTEIECTTFCGNADITGVTIPESITKIM